ncbi:hypothetical protein CAPI_00725 [Corynebacterium capitovis DSM 44611]|uniref:septum site-determining protein Ssd n=1 Tax=Corynebacterium capitovis TaxID=131081 RepID=UPI00036CD2C1|nr:septum site-determining protein Ssd [Corynebacterium capitovis]WKD56724.1 hypothetical protein CAPI_00725 [Corynebacterium capitovis DSM 44611]
MTSAITLTEPLLVAVDDASVHPEAIHIAAATGRPIVDVGPADSLLPDYPRAYAVLLDVTFAAQTAHLPPRPGVFLVGADLADVEATAAIYPHVSGSFVLPAQAGDVLRALSALASTRPLVKNRGRTIAVVGAAGGVGTSTFGAALARQAGAAHTPTLIDADRYSGGLDLLLGIEGEIGARWGEIVVGEGAVNRDDVRRALPATKDGIAVLTHARTTVNDPYALDGATLERLITAVGGAGLTVVDAPVDLLPRVDVVVVLTPAEVRGAAAAARLVAECAAAGATCAMVVRHRGWSSLSAQEVERVAHTHVVAEVGNIPRLSRVVETSGLPQRLPRALARGADAVLREVGL